MKIFSTNRTLLITLTLLCAHWPAQAANDTNSEAQSRWFQIEMIIFANNNLADANQEIWSKDLGLKYPQRIIKLKTAKDESTDLNSDDINSIVGTSTQTPSNLEPYNPSDNAISANPIHLASDSAKLTGGTAHTPPTHLLESAFTLLEDDELTLKQIARRIFSNANFRSLFHGAWRQPITDTQDSENILIQGGEQFDNHFELEGSINLTVQRYLHLNTNLWLSSFSSNAGQDRNPWPLLPKPPISSTTQSPHQKHNGQEDIFDQYSGNASNTLSPFENPFIDLSANQYSVEQSYAIRQHRRIRSHELHFIDHPLMGLLIKITPYELEQSQ